MSVAKFNHSSHSAEIQKSTDSLLNSSAELRETIPVGIPQEVAQGVWLVRLPLTASMDHVNIYVLDDCNGWTIVDTGSNTPECRGIIDELFLKGTLSTKPVSQVVATHYHADHVGLVGHIAEWGAEFRATRTCWLTARLLQMDQRTVPCEQEIRFLQQAGLSALDLAAYRRTSPARYASLVTPLPYAYHRLADGDVMTIGSRNWTIHCGHGHAAEHATLWSDDGLAIVGDQILPGISSNLSVHPSEPDSDLVCEYLESCRRFADLAGQTTVCLPGHGLPFTGIPRRCEQLIASQTAALRRLLEHLQRPSTAIDCLPVLYRRPLQGTERTSLIQEAVGFLNHLWKVQLVDREILPDHRCLWSRSSRALPEGFLLSDSATCFQSLASHAK